MRLVNIRPARGPRILIGMVPIAIALIIYAVFSAARAEANPNDKVLPTFLAMAQAAWRLFTQADPRTGEITAWADTSASLWRLGIGVGIATLSTLVIGIALGVVPLVRAALGPLVTVIAVIPPIAVLPILFIALGLGEASKIALIAVGIAPYMIRDLAGYV
ncbi:MAG TPA: ABC transporter permease, partial [Novosphingobium sp.]|nr:ABC transporter permease [Novosphingobium sp.]